MINNKPTNSYTVGLDNYDCDPDGINEIIEETGSNSYTAFRHIRWNKAADYKYDIRRYFMRSDGTEIPGKGISLTDDGVNRLAEMLTANFGDTKKIIGNICNRPDFVEAVAYATAPNAYFIHELSTAYKYLDDEESNKPLNAKELLSELL